MFISMSYSRRLDCLPNKFQAKGEIVFQKQLTSEIHERQQEAATNGFIVATPVLSKSKLRRAGGQSAAQGQC